MLAQALAAPGVAVVLCSMLDEAHLVVNLAAVEQPRFSAAEIAEFADDPGGADDPRAGRLNRAIVCTRSGISLPISATAR